MPLLIREETRAYTRHDQLHKELIQTFFQEFLEVFFPEVHDHLDFRAIKPISEEVHTDVLKGQTRRLDIVVETKLKDTDVVVIVHVEPQSYVETDFHERMFRYFSLLYNKYRKPVVPIAVFSHKENWEKHEYTMAFPFLQVLNFQFFTLHLKKENWRNYIRSDNPVAAALLSQMGYTEDEKIAVKKEFLRMMTRMELDSAKQRLIYGFFETYLTLSKSEEAALVKEISDLPEAEEILSIPISWEEKGKEIGKEIGKKEVALEMLKKELEIELIAEVTKLSRDEILELKGQL